MIKKLFVMLMVVALMFSFGCATVCKNGPDVINKLTVTIDMLKGLTSQLQLALLSGYDAEIELAYIVAKGSLSASQFLLAQSCPDATQVNDVVTSADKVSIPMASKGVMKAKKMKMIR
jgi:hypothetical protein